MKTIHRLAGSLLLLFAVLTPHAEVEAQDVPTVSVTRSCSYEECALWLDADMWGEKIVRGASGEFVGRTGMFRVPNLEVIVASSDSAARVARAFDAHHKRGLLALWTSTAMAVGGALATSENAGLAVGLNVGAIGVGAYAISRLIRSRRALNKAIWWYNGSLRSEES